MVDKKVDEDKIHEDDNVTFNISQVAKVLGVVPATIRNWEKAGLFVAKRSKNNYRVYSLDDVEELKKIKFLLDNQKLGGTGIKNLIVSDNPLISRVESIRQTTYSKKLLNERWKEMREKKGYTLEEVATAVGISPSHLSKLENGHANVSFEILQKIAHFYGESPIYFFNIDRSDKRKITLGNGEKIDLGIEGVTIESLIAAKDANIYPVMYTVEPGCGNLDSHSHNGQEFIFVLKGKIEVTLNGSEVYLLKKNDAFFFKGKELHSWKNPSLRNKAMLLWVHSIYDI